MSNFKINTIEIPEPNSFVITPFKISNKERLASGTLVKDIIDTKHTFELTYPFIHWEDMETFQDAFDTDEFITFQYEDEGTTKTVIVEIDSLPRRLRFTDTDTDKWLYTDVTIIMEEE